MPSADRPHRTTQPPGRVPAGPTARRALRSTRRRTGLLAGGAAAILSSAVLAPGAGAEIVRITSSPALDTDAPDVVTVATFPAVGRPERLVGSPVTGLPQRPAVYEAAPGGGPVAYAGESSVATRDEDFAEDGLRQAEAGVLPVGGGPARPFTRPGGLPLVPPTREFATYGQDQPPAAFTWAPDGTSVVLHAFGGDPRTDPWFAPPRSRRCDIASATCAAVVDRDVVDLAGGGTVEVEAGLTAPIGASRYLSRQSSGGAATARRFRTRAGRRYAVTVRVAGRTGTGATWTTTGRLRYGAPAFASAVPSAAGVLVRTSRVRAPRTTRRATYESVQAEPGRAVIVRRDGTIRSLGRFGYEVVGVLPDGRWVLTGGPGKRFEPGPTGLPLQTLDADGRIAPIRSGTRPVSPVWAASLAGLKDSLASTAKVDRAGVDAATGLLVLVMRFQDDDGGGRVVTVPFDGAVPPRLLRDPPGRASDDDYLVR